MGIKAGFRMSNSQVTANNVTVDGESYTGYVINIQVVFPSEILQKMSMNLPEVSVGDILIDQSMKVWKVYEVRNKDGNNYSLLVYIVNGYDFKLPLGFHTTTQQGLICSPVGGALPAPWDGTITALSVFRQAMAYTFETGGGGGGTSGSVDGIGSTSSTAPGSDAVGVKRYGSGTIIDAGTLTQALQNIYQILVDATPGTESDKGNGKIVKRDLSGSFWANEVKATATQAKWADYAEKYICKGEFIELGTVVVVSTHPDFEVERCNEDSSLKTVGIISENPGFLINSESDGVIVALKGMVPAIVEGPVNKGDILISTNLGYLRSATTKSEMFYKVALALESNESNNPKKIKVIL